MQTITRTIVLATLGLFVIVPGASALGGASLDISATANVAASGPELPDAYGAAMDAKAQVEGLRGDIEAKAEATLEQTQADVEARADASAEAGVSAGERAMAAIQDAFRGFAEFAGSLFASVSVSAGSK